MCDDIAAPVCCMLLEIRSSNVVATLWRAASINSYGGRKGINITLLYWGAMFWRRFVILAVSARLRTYFSAFSVDDLLTKNGRILRYLVETICHLLLPIHLYVSLPRESGTSLPFVESIIVPWSFRATFFIVSLTLRSSALRNRETIVSAKHFRIR